ncbi:MAG: hypothetical protein AB7E31_15570 [Desulfitobacterium sp.]
MSRFIKLKRLPLKKNKSQSETEQPKLVMDIIEEDYPEKYDTLKNKISQLGRLFTEDEWLTILMKSRAEHERFFPKHPDRQRKN